jgi:hypothetical protein
LVGYAGNAIAFPKIYSLASDAASLTTAVDVVRKNIGHPIMVIDARTFATHIGTASTMIE